MKYARCKCGACEFWGSGMEPARCARCEKCGSNLSYSPHSHEEPVPHDFSKVEKIQTDQGEMTITRCRYCHRTKADIEKTEKADAARIGQ